MTRKDERTMSYVDDSNTHLKLKDFRYYNPS